MTNKITNQIAFPDGLHEKVMSGVISRKFRVTFILAFSMLALNVIISIWNLWLTLGDAEIINTFRSLIETFDIDIASVSELFNTMKELLPLGMIIALLVNVTISLILIRSLLRFRKKMLTSFSLIA